jgi:hypothetical protein
MQRRLADWISTCVVCSGLLPLLVCWLAGDTWGASWGGISIAVAAAPTPSAPGGIQSEVAVMLAQNYTWNGVTAPTLGCLQVSTQYDTKSIRCCKVRVCDWYNIYVYMTVSVSRLI